VVDEMEAGGLKQLLEVAAVAAQSIEQGVATMPLDG